MIDSASWFTAQRVRRLALALEGLDQRAPGFAVANAHAILWPSCGGPRHEIGDLLSVLTRSGLAQQQSSRVFRTRQGQRLMDMQADRRRREFAHLLIRRGWYHDQVRQFLRVAHHREGVLIADRAAAAAVAPQLVGALHRLAQYPEPETMVIRGALVADLDSPWSLIPSVLPGAADARLTIGKRGEAYSFQFLRGRAADPDEILWVAADDETLGHDLEDHSLDPIQRIEVKASVETDVRFILSGNEYRHAHEHGSSYTVHFWGGINLHRDPATEYQDLVERGYPLVYADLEACIYGGVLDAEPREWLVTSSR